MALSKKQVVVSRSSTEVEYKSLIASLIEVLWLRSLMKELHLPWLLNPTIYCDNLNTVILTANWILHNHSKHFELDLHFVREKVV